MRDKIITKIPLLNMRITKKNKLAQGESYHDQGQENKQM